MRNKRLIWFLIAILFGLALGLGYGWLVNPLRASNTGLSSLRSDYQADYVLMVAERYTIDQDTAQALEWLRKLSPSDPAGTIKQALINGQQLGFSKLELKTISVLEQALALPEIVSTEATP